MLCCLQPPASHDFASQGRFQGRRQGEESSSISRMFGSLYDLGGGEDAGDSFRGFCWRWPPLGDLELVLDLEGLRRSLPGHWQGSQMRIE